VLTHKSSQSCGKCSRTKFDDLDAYLRSRWSILKSRSKKRRNKFDLEYETFKKLALGSCYYCGACGSNACMFHGKSLPHCGIDRIDSSKGYEESNIVSCCRVCNTAKLNMNVDDFRKWVRKIYSHWASK
jgi:5-methylcytosine-specific restriction endonuclease McrA